MSRLRAWLGAMLAIVAALVGAWAAGRREGRSRARTEATEKALEAEQTRWRIEDDIQQDSDLAGRARRSGLLRPDSK